VTRRLAVLAALLVALPAPGAHAEPGPATDGSCRAATPGSGERTGVFAGGPISIGPRTGRLTCSLQPWGPHSDPDLASATSPTTAGAVALVATATVTDAPPDTDVAVCTSVETDGEGTYYWRNEGGGWSLDPATYCGPWISDPEVWDPVGDLFEVVDPFVLEHVDPLACPLLAAVAPPQGDVYVADTFVWDCPPYKEGTP